MNTFADIIALGDTAAAANEPLVENWIKVRGSIYMLGHACGGLDHCLISEFQTLFPENFHDIPLNTREMLPDPQSYGRARNTVLRLLSMLGHIENPWEALRMMIRKARRDDIECVWGGLKTPALAAGLTPSEIRAEWVWSLDAEQGFITNEQGQRRQRREEDNGVPRTQIEKNVRTRLRRAVVKFDELFGIESVAQSGLLPPEPIGPPPVYNVLTPLPKKLDACQTASAQPDWSNGGLPRVWDTIYTSDAFELSGDPSPDDLLERDTWARIAALPTHTTGCSEVSWKTYVSRARATLLPHAKIPVPEHLPELFEKMIFKDVHRFALHLLWRQIYYRMPTKINAEPDELIDLATWRALWSVMSVDISPNTRKSYEQCARRILVHHSSSRIDPYQTVRAAWNTFTKADKAVLKPISKAAERSFFLPQEITSEWISDLNMRIDKEQHVAIMATLGSLPINRVDRDLPEDPVKSAWQSLRAAAQKHGLITRNLGPIERQAIQNGRLPTDIDRAWIIQIDQKTLGQIKRSTLQRSIQALDNLHDAPVMGDLLYDQKFGQLSDLRKRGKMDIPDSIDRELTAIHDAFKRADSTRREGRAVLRKIYTVAVNNNVKVHNLEELLLTAEALSGIDSLTRRKAARLLKDFRRNRQRRVFLN